MCDYSLHLVASRPARVGDKLISTSFPHTITRGFASADDRSTAVCLLPGTELAFEKEVRCETGMILSWGLGHKVAKFRQVNKGRSNVHHDALEFPDGNTVLLTQLCKGQRATVLQLPAGIGITVDDTQSNESNVASPVAARRSDVKEELRAVRLHSIAERVEMLATRRSACPSAGRPSSSED